MRSFASQGPHAQGVASYAADTLVSDIPPAHLQVIYGGVLGIRGPPPTRAVLIEQLARRRLPRDPTELFGEDFSSPTDLTYKYAPTLEGADSYALIGVDDSGVRKAFVQYAAPDWFEKLSHHYGDMTVGDFVGHPSYMTFAAHCQRAVRRLLYHLSALYGSRVETSFDPRAMDLSVTGFPRPPVPTRAILVQLNGATPGPPSEVVQMAYHCNAPGALHVRVDSGKFCIHAMESEDYKQAFVVWPPHLPATMEERDDGRTYRIVVRIAGS